MARRRGNGEGTISKRKDGRWEARYTAQTPKGPKRKVLYGKTRTEVAKKLTKAMSDRDGGLVFDHENLRVEEYLDRWLNDSVRDNVRHRTLDNYRLQVRRHVVPALGRIRLRNLSPAHVQGLYRAKLDAGLKPSSVRSIHAVLHRAMKQAVRWGLVPRNVTEAVDIPKLARGEVNALSTEETRGFLAAARGDRLEALYVLAVHCGLRRGELLGLRWPDVDLDARTLRVNRQVQRMRDGTGLVFSEPKNSKARRTVRLTNAASEALRGHRKRQAEERLRYGTLYQDQDLIFATAVGTPLEPSNIDRRSFKPLLAKAGLGPIRFHDLRHTCATLLLGKGVHPKFVQELLGHATIVITLDTYSHVLPGMGDQASRAIEVVLS